MYPEELMILKGDAPVMLLAPFLGQQGVLTHRGSSASQNTTQAVAYAQDLAVLSILKTQATCGGTFDHLILSSLRLVFLACPFPFGSISPSALGAEVGTLFLAQSHIQSSPSEFARGPPNG